MEYKWNNSLFMRLGYRTSQSSHLKISTTYIKHNTNAPFENYFESVGSQVKLTPDSRSFLWILLLEIQNLVGLVNNWVINVELQTNKYSLSAYLGCRPPWTACPQTRCLPGRCLTSPRPRRPCRGSPGPWPGGRGCRPPWPSWRSDCFGRRQPADRPSSQS